jgi:Mn2+/Fe2+ NRAMP family transporter
MFSTTLTCIDAYPRVLRPTTKMLWPAKFKAKQHDNKLYWVWMIIVMAGALIMLQYFATSMRFMVDVATTVSFVTAPVFAFLNYKVVTGKYMPLAHRPGLLLRAWAWMGMVFLWLFTLFYIAWRLGFIIL